jgi:hypothetical protein
MGTSFDKGSFFISNDIRDNEVSYKIGDIKGWARQKPPKHTFYIYTSIRYAEAPTEFSSDISDIDFSDFHISVINSHLYDDAYFDNNLQIILQQIRSVVEPKGKTALIVTEGARFLGYDIYMRREILPLLVRKKMVLITLVNLDYYRLIIERDSMFYRISEKVFMK